MSEKMNAEIKQRWVDALRSGQYKQGKSFLATIQSNGDAKYCCLGVLCELAVQDGIVRRQLEDDGHVTYHRGLDSSRRVLPSTVVEWAGLTFVNPFITTESRFPQDGTLSGLNDRGDTFDFIAQIIEDQL